MPIGNFAEQLVNAKRNRGMWPSQAQTAALAQQASVDTRTQAGQLDLAEKEIISKSDITDKTLSEQTRLHAEQLAHQKELAAGQQEGEKLLQTGNIEASREILGQQGAGNLALQESGLTGKTVMADASRAVSREQLESEERINDVLYEQAQDMMDADRKASMVQGAIGGGTLGYQAAPWVAGQIAKSGLFAGASAAGGGLTAGGAVVTSSPIAGLAAAEAGLGTAGALAGSAVPVIGTAIGAVAGILVSQASWICTATQEQVGLNLQKVKTLRRLEKYAHEHHPQQIGWYLNNAPELVDAIKRSEGREYWQTVRSRLIDPLIDMVYEKRLEDAFRHYMKVTAELFKEYAPNMHPEAVEMMEAANG